MKSEIRTRTLAIPRDIDPPLLESDYRILSDVELEMGTSTLATPIEFSGNDYGTVSATEFETKIKSLLILVTLTLLFQMRTTDWYQLPNLKWGPEYLQFLGTWTHLRLPPLPFHAVTTKWYQSWNVEQGNTHQSKGHWPN